jgi:hypothetical protein
MRGTARLRMSVLRAATFVVGLALAPGAAAQSSSDVTEAERLYQEGLAAVDAGNLASAAAAFERSFALNPVPDVLYNVGMCRKGLGDYPAAANAFRDYVALVGDRISVEERAELEALLLEILPRVGRLVFDDVPEGAAVRLDGAAVGTTPLGVWVAVAAGTIAVSAEREGFQPATAAVPVRAGQAVPVELAWTPLAEVPAGGGGDVESSGLGAGFWTSVAIGGAAAIGMAVTGGLALATKDDYEASGWTDRELYDRAGNLGIATDVLLGVAAAGAVAALIFGLLPDDEEQAESSETPAGVAVLPTGLAVWW